MIVLRDISLRQGPHILLENMNWTIFQNQKIGIIGANGTGKTSFFAMLLGKIQPEKGELNIPSQIKFSYVAQENMASSMSALSYVLSGDKALLKLQAELKSAEETGDGFRIAELHGFLNALDAYTAKARAAQLLHGLGFSENEQNAAVKDFSGGWQVRLNLAKALMAPSDILLLDEPTNHLDLDALLWLESWLQHYEGTLLVISHDRDFLDHTVQHIAHFSNKNIQLYKGNYSAFEKALAAHLLLQQATFEKQQKHVAHLQSFINRFRAKASKARQAQSRIKALERLEIVSQVQAESPFHFEFKEPKKCPNPLIHLEDVTISYGSKTILQNVGLNIAPDNRIALIGPNGAGKTSLIKCIAGLLTPTHGKINPSPYLKIGYFAQHQIDQLNLNESPLSHLQKITGTQDQTLRNFLGYFGFSNERIFEPIKNFSGGEKSRLALALIVIQRPNLLLLDEPTNHLDLEMRNALSLSLQAYTGAMIIISHDRFLLRTTVDELILVAEGKVQRFEGNLKDYEKWLTAYRKTSKNQNSENNVSLKKTDSSSLKQQRALLKKLNHIEIGLEKLKNEYKEMELKLASPATSVSLKEDWQALSAIQGNIQQMEEKWLTLFENLEELKKDRN